MRGRSGSAAFASALLLVALVSAGGALHVVDAGRAASPITSWWITNAICAFTLGLPGLLVAARRPRNPIGWILVAVGFGHAATLATREYGVLAVTHHLPGAAWAVWVGTWAWLDIALLGIAFAVFPDGGVRGRPWRLVPIVLCVAGEVVLAGGNAVYPGPMFYDGPLRTLQNPLGWAWAGRRLDELGYAAPSYGLAAAIALGVLVMVAQVPRATRAVRRQILVVAPAAVLFTAELTFEIDGSDRITRFTAPVVLTVLAVSLAAAILRYGLYELDVVVSRTLVYGALTAVLAGSYLGTVAVAQAFVGGGLVASLAGATLVAALFAPLRDRLQDAVDTVLFGARRDPYAVIAQLGQQFDNAGDVLPALAETVAQTLKLPYVAIELAGARAAEVGTLRGTATRLPLPYAGEVLGELVLGPRTPGDPFTRSELRLFDDVARQVAVAAHAGALAAELQRSRERLVAAREEERRRLRRDLHDGLGPALAGMALQLGNAKRLVERDPVAAQEMLDLLVAEAQGAIADVRRLVYDLRPPALDELGLVQALRQQSARFPDLDVEISAPQELDGLPAAVEVAAFRIGTEAVTNVARHARASRCVVELSLNGSLELRVADDGGGFDDGWRPGVGMSSMRERAGELGGTCTFRPRPGGGTEVVATLPVARP